MAASWDGGVSHTILGPCDLDLWPSFSYNCVQNISLIIFELGIPNLVCGCIFGLWSVMYHLRVTVILTYDLVSKVIMSGAYLLFILM